MKKRVFGRRLGRDTNQRKALFRSLTTALVTHGRIDTTEAKAKAVRPFVEKLVTTSKVGDLNARRQLLSKVPSTSIVDKLLDSVGPVFKNRAGGYTRLIRLGFRPGDNATMVRLEFVEELKDSPKKPGPYATKRLAAKQRAKTKEDLKKVVVKSKVSTKKETK